MVKILNETPFTFSAKTQCDHCDSLLLVEEPDLVEYFLSKTGWNPPKHTEGEPESMHKVSLCCPACGLFTSLLVSRIVFSRALKIAKEREGVSTHYVPGLSRVTDIATGSSIFVETEELKDIEQGANVDLPIADGVYEVKGDNCVLIYGSAIEWLVPRSLGIELKKLLAAAPKRKKLAYSHCIGGVLMDYVYLVSEGTDWDAGSATEAELMKLIIKAGERA